MRLYGWWNLISDLPGPVVIVQYLSMDIPAWPFNAFSVAQCSHGLNQVNI